MNTPRLHTNLSVLGYHFLPLAIDFNTHDPSFDAEVFGLELVEVQEGTFGAGGTVDETPEVGRDVGALEGVFVGLAEEETAAGWGLEEFGC